MFATIKSMSLPLFNMHFQIRWSKTHSVRREMEWSDNLFFLKFNFFFLFLASDSYPEKKGFVSTDKKVLIIKGINSSMTRKLQV